MKIRVGTRDSQLAMAQTQLCVQMIREREQDVEMEIVSMKTVGDRVLSVPLSSIGTTALFTKELETALLDGRVDFVVHSLKDVPTKMPAGLTLAAVIKREDPRDALVMRKGLTETSLDALPDGAVIGTSSRRRTAQLRRIYPNLIFRDIRGNLNTRLKKLDADDSNYSALVLAAAGLIRLGWNDRIAAFLENMPYAVGQGAMAIQCRSQDEHILRIIRKLDDNLTRLECEAEREVMRAMEGGCSVPLGMLCSWDGAKLQLQSFVTSMDGKRQVYVAESMTVITIEDAKQLGKIAASQMLRNGAKEILDEVRQVPPGDFLI